MITADWQQKIGNSKGGFFHHAFLIEGKREELLPLLRDFLAEEFKVEVAGNPDFLELEFVAFKVDDGRELKTMQSRRASSEGAKKIFVLSANSFTTEAQNSLLKIFEEPTDDTVFFVLTPSAQFFLPTLLSRVAYISTETEEDFGEAKKFLKMNITERLALVAAIMKELKDDDEDKDPERAQRLIEDIIRFYHEKGQKGKRSPEETRALELALKYHGYAHGNAPSFKQMLEHLSLVAPR